MPEFPHHLDRTVVIRATPETVFRFFTDSPRWASWWGAGSTIDPVVGGQVYIRHPNGVEVRGEVLEIAAPERIVFTYDLTPSRVTIRLEPDQAGTRLHLEHEFADAGPRDEHVQGWRFQLSLFANAVANEVYAGAQSAVDSWFTAWLIADEQAREEALARIVSPGIAFRDRYSLLDGIPDLVAHIGASQRFMPGIGLRRNGEVRQCQGTVLADWIAARSDGKALMTGTNVFVFGADGKIGSVCGLSDASGTTPA